MERPRGHSTTYEEDHIHDQDASTGVHIGKILLKSVKNFLKN